MPKLNDVLRELKNNADLTKADLYARFFKTGKGEYGEGDKFWGIIVPVQRNIAKRFRDLSFAETIKLLHNPVHECRLTALFILAEKWRVAEKASDGASKKKIYDAYLANTKYINSWDLVDVTVRDLVGSYLYDKDRAVLYRLAKSRSLWERRMAIIATSYFISRGQFGDTLKIAKMLMTDKHDLIHKAVGWMLREVGKRDVATLEKFLKKHIKVMPRTMLRYAIEKFPEARRKEYLVA